MRRKNTENMTEDQWWDHQMDRALKRNWQRILRHYGREWEPFEPGDDVKVSAGQEHFWCEILTRDPDTGEYLAAVCNHLVADLMGAKKKHYMQYGDFLFLRSCQVRDVVREGAKIREERESKDGGFAE